MTIENLVGARLISVSPPGSSYYDSGDITIVLDIGPMVDAGAPDTALPFDGSADSGGPDAASPGLDGSANDGSQPSPDGGASDDAGSVSIDGGNTDGSGSVDAARDLSAVVRPDLAQPPYWHADGSFTLKGQFSDYQKQCDFARTFQFSFDGFLVDYSQSATVTEALPLRSRQEAQIALLDRGDQEVHLEARTPYQGAHRVEWTVSDGEIVSRDGARLHWRLPERAGLYQVELLVDYGDNGFALDTMTFEVA